MKRIEKLKIIVKVTLLSVMFAFLASCSGDDNSPFSYSSESTIFSNSNQRVLRELMFILKPYVMHENTKKYIVVSEISNIRVLINSEEWGIFSSSAIDVSQVKKEEVENFYVRTEPVKYVTRAPYIISDKILTTAGEYSELLGRYISLQPGGYICQIEYIELTDNAGNTYRAYPLIAEYFEVKENTVSAYIGEFEILIDR